MLYTEIVIMIIIIGTYIVHFSCQHDQMCFSLNSLMFVYNSTVDYLAPQLKSSNWLFIIPFQFCDDNQLEFLPWRCWIGFWVMLILFGVVAMEGCFLVRYFTRFTEEIFACLISAIFINEAINYLKMVRS